MRPPRDRPRRCPRRRWVCRRHARAACRAFQRARCRGVTSSSLGYSGIPHSRANASAPGPHSSTWGVSSQTRRAARIGFFIVLTHATAPARSVLPSMQLASSSTSPAAVRHAPVPALNEGSSSSTTAAACAASSALPPCRSTRRPTSAAARVPARYGVGSWSGRVPAPPCTTTAGPPPRSRIASSSSALRSPASPIGPRRLVRASKAGNRNQPGPPAGACCGLTGASGL